MNRRSMTALLAGLWLASMGFGRAEETIREVPVDGFRLTYVVEGSGTPCLVINDASAMQKGLSPGLRKRFKFIFMNPRMNVPYDPSFDLGRITLDTLVDDVEAVRRAAGEDRVVVFGHSINGLVAYEYARKYPERVLGVVMNGTPPFRNERFSKIYADYWESRASPERKEALRKSREKTREAIAKLDPGEAMRQTYIAAGAVYWNDPAYDCAWLLEGVRWNKEVWDRLFEGIVEGYDIATREPIRKPVWLALGRNDFAVPFISWDGLDRILPNLKIVLFEKSGHWPFVDERELFDARLLGWLDGIPGAR
ncbi:MAG: alpha/beta fold hydrolase [Candidatus Aminicenantales bacterium]